MNKKFIIFFLISAFSYALQAQDVVETDSISPLQFEKREADNQLPSASTAAKPVVRFGFLSYSEVIRLMPEYISAQEKLNRLQEKYEAELQRSDKEFNRKYAEFLEGQKEFPENILLKRQKELQELMEKSIQFRDETKELLANVRKEMTAPIMEKLNEAIRIIGLQHQFEYVLNTDNNTYPYINKSVGMDITSLVKSKLNIK